MFLIPGPEVRAIDDVHSFGTGIWWTTIVERENIYARVLFVRTPFENRKISITGNGKRGFDRQVRRVTVINWPAVRIFPIFRLLNPSWSIT